MLLWDWFFDGFSNGSLVASEELLEEVCQRGKKDVASRLIETLDQDGLLRVLTSNSDTFAHIAGIEAFVREHFEPQHADVFLRGKDGLLIALAKTHRVGIITLERYGVPQFNSATGKIKGKVPLPYVAWAFGVRCISLFQAFLDLPQKETAGSRVG